MERRFRAAFGDGLERYIVRSVYTPWWRRQALPLNDSLTQVHRIGQAGTALVAPHRMPCDLFRTLHDMRRHAAGNARSYAATARVCDGSRASMVCATFPLI
jgi:hypothetical protein